MLCVEVQGNRVPCTTQLHKATRFIATQLNNTEINRLNTASDEKPVRKEHSVSIYPV